MTDRELHQLSRRNLIDLLYQLKAEEESLKEQIKTLQTQLSERDIKLKNAGSLAEAMVSVNGVMEAAQNAADQYLEEIKRAHLNVEKDCEQMLESTKEDCQRREEETQLNINAKWKEFTQKVESYIRTHSELETLLDSSKHE